MATGGAPHPAGGGRSLLSPMSPTSGLVAPPEAIPTSPRGGAEAGVQRCNGRRIRGKCKWFDVAKGFGFITPITQSGTPMRPEEVLGTSLLGWLVVVVAVVIDVVVVCQGIYLGMLSPVWRSPTRARLIGDVRGGSCAIGWASTIFAAGRKG